MPCDLGIRWTISQPALSLSMLAMEKVQTLSTCYNLLIILTFLTPTVCTTYISNHFIKHMCTQ